MAGFFSQLKGKLRTGAADDDSEEHGEEYVEIGPEGHIEGGKAKISVRPFVMDDFEDIKQILDVMREGYTIALINIKPLKDKDLVELKRAVNKLKKTTDAIDGDIAGFGEDWIVVTPSFASVYRTKEIAEVKGDMGGAPAAPPSEAPESKPEPKPEMETQTQTY